MGTPMTRDTAELLEAVLLDPADTSVRLMLADALEEAGEGQRAEFIRVQCELARADDSWRPPEGLTPSEARDRLRRRQRELLKANFGLWTDGLPESLVTKQCPSCEGQAPDWETG